MIRRSLFAAGLVLLGFSGAAGAAGPPFELTATRAWLFGPTPGTLVIAEDGVTFRARAPKDSRAWKYADLKQIRILSPTRMRLATYEAQDLLRFGADREYTFNLNGAVSPEVVSFLLARVQRPLVTAVLPSLPGEPLFAAPVRHARYRRGSSGTLALFDNGLAYATDRAGEARFWRFADIFAVLPLDAVRLLVLAYEGDPGETRPFTFDLKEPLPAGMSDALWQRVNRPDGRPRRVGFELEAEMNNRLTMATILALGVAAGGDSAAALGAQHLHAAPASTSDSMMQCHTMMAGLHANTPEIEALAAKMNAATGPAKVTAMADLLTALVKERTTALAAMNAMHPPAAAALGAPAPVEAPPAALGIALRTTPDPPRMGDNALEVTLKDAMGQPVTDAMVTVTFDMPAMPKMSMPAMRNAATLRHEGGGVYRGTGQVMMAGKWDVTVAATRGGQTIGTKALTVVAKP